jgi:hypothetical protein
LIFSLSLKKRIQLTQIINSRPNTIIFVISYNFYNLVSEYVQRGMLCHVCVRTGLVWWRGLHDRNALPANADLSNSRMFKRE